MTRRHRWLALAALLIAVAAWIAWTMLTVETDVG
jgi:hypothetical protein